MDTVEKTILASLQCKAVHDYLMLVENTESSRLFHVMSFLTSISAAMGRRYYVDWLEKKKFANLFAVLAGPPAAKKSVAITISTSFLEEIGTVKFAPHDTGGNVKGLLDCMTTAEEKRVKEEDEELFSALNDEEILDPNIVGNMPQNGRPIADRATLHLALTELSSLLNRGNTLISTFLLQMYDGDIYRYSTRLKKDVVLRDGLLTLLAATTPAVIQKEFSPELIGQGLLSRMIFVYDDRNFKEVVRPPPFDKELKRKIHETYERISYGGGKMSESAGAIKLITELYRVKNRVKDPRFAHYNDRRPTHLDKLAMVFAALDDSLRVEQSHVLDADKVLTLCEYRMPEAFGEYGLTKDSIARQTLLDLLKSSVEALPKTAVWALMNKYMTEAGFNAAVTDFVQQKRISEVTDKKGNFLLMYNPETKPTMALALKAKVVHQLYDEETGEEYDHPNKSTAAAQ